MPARTITTTLACGTLALLTGCASFSPSSLLGPKIQFADAQNPAREVISLWEPGEGKSPEGMPARGFNGTILFFDRSHTAPIGVHGTLTFYVYDDYGPRGEWSEPIAEFSFSPDEWDHFFTMGALGPSYRIFIPYPRTHPYQVNTTLWVKFEPADGNPTFYSKRTPIVLPGPLREDDQVQVLETTEIRGYEPEKMQDIVSASFSEEMDAETQDSRIHTLHRWETKPRRSNSIQLANYEVTQRDPAGVFAGSTESAPGAAAESWGSTPPALFSTPKAELPATRKRFKLGTPE